MVRHPIPRKRNVFHYLAISWIGNLLASISTSEASHVLTGEADQHLGETFKNLHKFMFPVQSTDNPEMQ